MLVRLLKYVRGYVKIRVEGYSPERFLNLCNVHNILLWGVETKEQAYEMYLSVRDFKKLRPLVKKTGTKVSLQGKYGLPFFFHRFRKRKMFFGGMIFCVLLVYWLSLFVWNIHLEGNVTQTTAEILDYLKTIDVSHGTKKSEIVCETIEKKLRANYPNMLWVSAELRGTRMMIQIKENEDGDIISKIEEKNVAPVSIAAETDGVVQSIVSRQGTPLVKAGDTVSAGQILVEGWYAVKNDAGEIVRYEGVPADADIWLVKTEHYHDSFSTEYKQKWETGKKRHGITFRLFDKKWGFTPKLAHKHYTVLKKQYDIHVTENFYLPFSVEIRTYTEYQTKKRSFTKEQLAQLADRNFQKNYEIILQKGVQIIEKNVRIDTNGKLCSVDGTVRLLIPVRKKVAAVIPEPESKISQEGEN